MSEHKFEEVPRERVFLQFVYGLYAQSLVLLGDAEHPETGKKAEPQLDEAKFLIDTLDVLAEKTKSNLTPQEEDALSRVVADLKMRHFQRRSGS